MSVYCESFMTTVATVSCNVSRNKQFQQQTRVTKNSNNAGCHHDNINNIICTQLRQVCVSTTHTVTHFSTLLQLTLKQSNFLQLFTKQLASCLDYRNHHYNQCLKWATMADHTATSPWRLTACHHISMTTACHRNSFIGTKRVFWAQNIVYTFVAKALPQTQLVELTALPQPS